MASAPPSPSSCAGCATAKIKTVTTAPSPRFTLLQRLILAIVPPLVSALIWLCGLTWRFRIIAPEGVTPTVFGERSPSKIFCFWHQCVLPCTVYFRYSRAVILISQSFDGELVTRVLKIFGFDAVRGSSSRGAREGLLGLANVIETGRTAIFTADGPRGPIYQTKMGPIKLAQTTGAPIGAFHLQPEHAWVIGSWDKFLIPKPFTRICVSWGPWTHVPSDLAPEDFEPKRQQLNDAIEFARLRSYDYFKKAHK
jgi:lysophospholipid acyltransferase (LPLAT)-like uncharacterized protein